MGLAIMFLAILPELDVVKGAMLTNCVCFVPGLLGTYFSKSENLSQSEQILLSIYKYNFKK